MPPGRNSKGQFTGGGTKIATLVASLEADSTGFDRTLNGVQSDLKSFAGGNFKKFFLGLGIGAALKETLDTTIGLEKQFAGLSKAANLSAEGTAKFKREIFALSTTLRGISIEDLIAIETSGGKLGIASENLHGYAEGVTRVAAAIDDIPAGVLADEIGKVNSVFKLDPVRGVQQLGSAIDKVADSGVSSAKGILEVTQRISGAAVAAKITAQESIALAGALLDTGTEAEAGATALAQLIQALNDAGAQKGFAKTIGTDADKFAATVKAKPIQAIEQFLTALRKLDASGQQTALADIGIEGVRGGLNIQKLSQQVLTLDKYIESSNDEFVTLNQLTLSYNTNAALTASGVTEFGNRLTILKDAVGSALLPAFNSILGVLGDLTTGFAESARRVPESFAAMTAGAAEAGEHFKVFGFDATEAFADVRAGLANIPDFLAIAGLKIQEVVTNAGIEFQTMVTNLGIVADYLSGNWYQLIEDAVNGVGALFGNLGKNIKEFALAVVGYLQDPTKGFQFDFTPLLDGFKQTADRLPDFLSPVYVSYQDEVDRLLTETGKKIQGQKDAAAAAAGGKKPGEDVGGTAGEGGGEFKATRFELADAARKLRAGAPGSDEAKRLREIASRQLTSTEKIEKYQQKQLDYLIKRQLFLTLR